MVSHPCPPPQKRWSTCPYIPSHRLSLDTQATKGRGCATRAYPSVVYPWSWWLEGWRGKDDRKQKTLVPLVHGLLFYMRCWCCRCTMLTRPQPLLGGAEGGGSRRGPTPPPGSAHSPARTWSGRSSTRLYPIPIRRNLFHFRHNPFQSVTMHCLSLPC